MFIPVETCDRKNNSDRRYLHPADMWGWRLLFYQHATVHFTKPTCLLQLKSECPLHLFCQGFYDSWENQQTSTTVLVSANVSYIKQNYPVIVLLMEVWHPGRSWWEINRKPRLEAERCTVEISIFIFLCRVWWRPELQRPGRRTRKTSLC